jgi:hypothetical protein
LLTKISKKNGLFNCKAKIIYIISAINKINNFTKDIVVDIVTVFVHILTVFAISHQGEAKNPNVGAIKNSRLVPDYLQTCNSTFRILILWKNIYIFIYFCIFSSEG